MRPLLAALLVIGLSVAVVLATRAAFQMLERRGSRHRQRPKLESSNHAYDKAKYHDESCDEFGLPARNASLLDVFFFSWLIQRGLTSTDFELLHSRFLERYR